MEETLNPTEVLKQAAETVTQQSVTFEIDVSPQSKFEELLQRMRIKKKKRNYEIRPLTPAQLYKVSCLLLTMDVKNMFSNGSDGILQMMKDHSWTVCEIVATAVTASRHKPSKKLIDLFFHNLPKDDLKIALRIVLQQMNIISFIDSITSIRSLNILESVTANVMSADENEVNPLTQESTLAPGLLSAV